VHLAGRAPPASLAPTPRQLAGGGRRMSAGAGGLLGVRLVSLVDLVDAAEVRVGERLRLHRALLGGRGQVGGRRRRRRRLMLDLHLLAPERQRGIC